MLEETSSKSKELARRVAHNLDKDAVHNTICDFYQLKDESQVEELKFDDDAERGLFRAYHILERLKDYGFDTKCR